jgi:hypothetical protein
MTIQVELSAEIEAQLVAEARVQGIPLEKVAERLLAGMPMYRCSVTPHSCTQPRSRPRGAQAAHCCVPGI